MDVQQHLHAPGPAESAPLGAITANGLATGRDVTYVVVTDLPDGDFTIPGDAFFNGPSPSPPTPVRQGNWQIKVAFTTPVPCRSRVQRQRSAGAGSRGEGSALPLIPSRLAAGAGMSHSLG